ncbi:flavin reductase family protein [Burkholderia ubonensis]|uniref:flavin reductase family protein n=1 Tax=Burkholderia ubonensis TaxID=101571 RepID=UPI000B0CCA85|nr:flavin reductase family protein [Burkholderia ubonensis]
MNERRTLTPDFDRARADDARDAAKLVRNSKQAMRRLTAAVATVATREQASRYGMTATALSAFCADPPSMLVYINRNATLYTSLSRTRRFSENLLHGRPSDLIEPFSGKPEHDTHVTFGVRSHENDLPVLDDAQATLLCRVDGGIRYGSYDVEIGCVEAATAIKSISPLLWRFWECTCRWTLAFQRLNCPTFWPAY